MNRVPCSREPCNSIPCSCPSCLADLRYFRFLFHVFCMSLFLCVAIDISMREYRMPQNVDNLLRVVRCELTLEYRCSCPVRVWMMCVQYYSAPESVMEKVGIGLDDQVATAAVGNNKRLMCRICCDEYTGKEAFALPCKHLFCRGCWAAYLIAKVRGRTGEKGEQEKGGRECCCEHRSLRCRAEMFWVDASYHVGFNRQHGLIRFGAWVSFPVQIMLCLQQFSTGNTVPAIWTLVGVFLR